MSYSYDPARLSERGVDALRFAIGDVAQSGNEQAAILADEEIAAVLAESRSFLAAKVELLKSIMFRLQYDVNISDSGMSIGANERAERFGKLYECAKRELQAAECVPRSGAVRDSLSAVDGGHYFHNDMHNNPHAYGGGDANWR